jgi:glycosidase
MSQLNLSARAYHGILKLARTIADLAGLEKALREEGENEVELAIRRILLIHGIIMTVGGIPLIYLGDEIATLNDYTYRDDPAKARDSRWVHRPRADWEHYGRRNNPETVEGRIYQGLQTLIRLRKEHPVFAGGELEIIPTENEHVLGFVRTNESKRAVIFANFSENEQVLPARILEQYNCHPAQIVYGNSQLILQKDLALAPLELLVFSS